MSVDVVAEKIRQKALEDSNRSLKKAETEASEIKKEILNRAEEKKRQILIESESACKSIAQVNELKFKLQARKNNLEARQKVISSTVDVAIDKLRNLEDNKLLNLLENLILKNSMPGRVEIIISKNNFDKYRNLMGQKLQEWQKLLSQKFAVNSELIIKVGDFASDSVILSGENWDIDCRFDILIKDILEKNERQISKILFK